MGDWVTDANPADLDLVAQALDDGRLSLHGATATAVQRLGLGDAGAVLSLLDTIPGASPATVAWCLRRLAAERRAAMDRHARGAQLVWSGLGEAPALRDTRAVLAEVCARAERHVLLATYVIYDGRRSLSALARRMREAPGLQVDLYVDLRSARRHGMDEPAVVAAWSETFLAEHWPGDVPLPTVWYCPTTLHAKCVVVDGRWTFVTSANLTEAAQTRNLEVGVLLDHPALAQSLCAQFQSARERGEFRRMPAI